MSYLRYFLIPTTDQTIVLSEQGLDLLILGAIVSILSGMAVWFFVRVKNKNAVAQAESNLYAKSTILESQNLTLKENFLEMQSRYSEIETKYIETRENLENSRNETVQYKERANRVPDLEKQCVEVEKKMSETRDLLEDSRQEATQYAERANRVPELESKYSELEKNYTEARNQLDIVRQESTQYSERANRIPELENLNSELEKKLIHERELLDIARTEATQYAERANRVPELESQSLEFEKKYMHTRDLLDISQKKLTQYEERANRVPGLESQCAEVTSQLTKAQNEISRIVAQLSERTQGLEDAHKRVNIAETAQQEERKHMEEIQDLLREEIAKSAKVIEQASRIPELERIIENQKNDFKIANDEIAGLKERNGSSEASLKKIQQQIEELIADKASLTIKRDTLIDEQQLLATKIAELNITIESERNQNTEKIVLLTEAKENLSNQFKTLANEILEEKTKRFTEQNQTNLNQLLAPLQVKLTEFQGKVEEVYVKEGKDRSALAEQVKNLMALNQQLSQDAHNLTTALKGQVKTQGNWGEMILEKILESSGLRKGFEFVVQECYTNEEGSRMLPDVVVHLPEDRDVIIDSKVSLTAYEEYISADSESRQASALQRHILSLNNHIKSLSEKNYSKLSGIKSHDWVIMFIPIEPAYILAMTTDEKIGKTAWEKNIMLVCPSMLMFVLRTVSQLWRQEAQRQNVQQIVKRGEELYDKFVGFVADLEGIGDKLKQTQKIYDGAYGKLTGGKGNLVNQANKLKNLGLKPSKKLPQSLEELAFNEGEDFEIEIPRLLNA